MCWAVFTVVFFYLCLWVWQSTKMCQFILPLWLSISGSHVPPPRVENVTSASEVEIPKSVERWFLDGGHALDSQCPHCRSHRENKRQIQKRTFSLSQGGKEWKSCQADILSDIPSVWLRRSRKSKLLWCLGFFPLWNLDVSQSSGKKTPANSGDLFWENVS